MTISKLKTSFTRMNVPAKIEFSRNIINRLTGNSNFPTPDVSVKDLSKQVDALEAAFTEASDGGKHKKQVEREAESALDEMLRRNAHYVMRVAGRDLTMLLSSGYELYSETKSANIPDLPMNIRADVENKSGHLMIRWDKVSDASFYNIIVTEDDKIELKPGVGFTQIQSNKTICFNTASSCKQELNGLQSATTYYIYICAGSAAGVGQFSQPVKAIVI